MTRYSYCRIAAPALLATMMAGQAGAQLRTPPARPASPVTASAAPAIPAVKAVSFGSRSVPMVGGAHDASSTGGQEVVLRVELAAPAPCVERCGSKAMDGSPSGYMPVTLAASDPAHLSALRLLVPTGQTYGELAFVTKPVAAPVALTVTAQSQGSAPQQGRLTILPPVMTGFALEQSSAVSGHSVKGTVRFSGPPASATAVRFQLQTTMGQAVSVPATVALELGKTAAEITVTAKGVAADQNAHVVAIYGDKTLAAPLTVRAARLVRMDNEFPCCDNPFTLGLDGAPPPAGAVISLTSEKPSRIGVPATVTIPPGETSINITAVSYPGNDDDRVRITASYNGVTKHWSVLSRKIVKPDLVLRDITFLDGFGNVITSAADGQPIRMCVTVRAQREGEMNPNLDAPPSVLRITHQSPTGTGTSAGRTIDLPIVFVRDINRQYPPITQCITIPGLTQGDRLDVTLLADFKNEVDESREGNNDAKASITRP
jgi:hypothetical protein